MTIEFELRKIEADAILELLSAFRLLALLRVKPFPELFGLLSVEWLARDARQPGRSTFEIAMDQISQADLATAAGFFHTCCRRADGGEGAVRFPEALAFCRSLLTVLWLEWEGRESQCQAFMN